MKIKSSDLDEPVVPQGRTPRLASAVNERNGSKYSGQKHQSQTYRLLKLNDKDYEREKQISQGLHRH
jgi:hypothetical protein